MSDPLTDLISDIQHNGLRWVSFVTAANYIYNEFRKYKLDKRDEAMFHNIKLLVEERGKGEWFVENPNSKRNLERQLLIFGWAALFRALSVLLFIRPMAIKNWRFNMQNLLSKKFLLAILGAIIPVINLQFGLNLTLDDLMGVWSILGIAIAAIAHVDGKKVLAAANAVKVAITADPNATYRDMIKTINIVHNGITSIHDDLKKDDGLKAFRDAADDYKLLESIVLGFKKPAPLPDVPVIPEQKVSA